jgi:hypothetical protein
MFARLPALRNATPLKGGLPPKSIGHGSTSENVPRPLSRNVV